MNANTLHASYGVLLQLIYQYWPTHVETSIFNSVIWYLENRTPIDSKHLPLKRSASRSVIIEYKLDRVWIRGSGVKKSQNFDSGFGRPTGTPHPIPITLIM